MISRVEEENNDFKLKTKKDSGLLKKIEKKFRVARRAYDSIYQSATGNFLPFVNSLDLHEINEFNEDIRLSGLGMLNVNEQAFSCSLLEAFDFFII